jgi:hypothetical protein
MIACLWAERHVGTATLEFGSRIRDVGLMRVQRYHVGLPRWR